MSWWAWLIVGVVAWLVAAGTLVLAWSLHAQAVIRREMRAMSASVDQRLNLGPARSRRPQF